MPMKSVVEQIDAEADDRLARLDQARMLAKSAFTGGQLTGAAR